MILTALIKCPRRVWLTKTTLRYSCTVGWPAGGGALVNATAHLIHAWVAQQLRAATPFGETAKHVICDNDTKFGPVFEAAAKTCGLEVVHTPYVAPLANAICDGFVGSEWRECLDHLLVLGNRQLVRVLVE